MRNPEELRNLPLPALRERVMDDLAAHFARENIGLDEYDERCGRAAGASRREDLFALVSDLPDLSLPAVRSAGTGLSPRSEAASPKLNGGTVREIDPIVNVFFGTERKGVWKPARNTVAVNVFGGTELDLRKAILPPGGCVIRVVCVFGGCEIIVPEGVRVEVRGMGVFGGFSKSVDEEAEDESMPLVRVEGIAVFGGCEVKGPRRKG